MRSQRKLDPSLLRVMVPSQRKLDAPISMRMLMLSQRKLDTSIPKRNLLRSQRKLDPTGAAPLILTSSSLTACLTRMRTRTECCLLGLRHTCPLRAWGHVIPYPSMGSSPQAVRRQRKLRPTRRSGLWLARLTPSQSTSPRQEPMIFIITCCTSK